MTVSITDRRHGAAWTGRLPPAIVAVFAHLIAATLTAAIVRLAPDDRVGPFALTLTQGIFAAALGQRLGLPAWWIPINFAFVPMAAAIAQLQIDPCLFLGAFLALVSVYRTSAGSRVPLFLSSREACRALIDLLPPGPGVRVLDLGCGTGTVLSHIAQARSDVQARGSELAPLPALIAAVRLRKLSNCRPRREDFWHLPFGEFDLVYAFLSPAVMPRLWAKVCREMKPGSLFVSNSFDVPGIEPHQVVGLRGSRSSALFVWRF